MVNLARDCVGFFTVGALGRRVGKGRGAMDPIVMATGTALIGAMATDAWQQTRAAVVRWWRARSGAAGQESEQVGTELEGVRGQIVAARERGDEATEEALAGLWRLRFQQLLDADPQLSPVVQELLDELMAVLPAAEQNDVRQVIINARSHDNSRQYIAARDVHVNDQPREP